MVALSLTGLFVVIALSTIAALLGARLLAYLGSHVHRHHLARRDRRQLSARAQAANDAAEADRLAKEEELTRAELVIRGVLEGQSDHEEAHPVATHRATRERALLHRVRHSYHLQGRPTPADEEILKILRRVAK